MNNRRSEMCSLRRTFYVLHIKQAYVRGQINSMASDTR